MVRWKDHLSPRAVVFLSGRTADEALAELTGRFHTIHGGVDAARLLATLQERERALSSWIARGIAMPHALVEAHPRAQLVLGLSRGGLDWPAPDGEPVRLVVLLAGGGREHLPLLRQLAARLNVPGLVDALVGAQDEESAWRCFTEAWRPERRPPAASARRQVSRRCLAHAVALAREVDATAVLVHAEGLAEPAALPAGPAPPRLLLVTTTGAEELARELPDVPCIQVPFRGGGRNPVELALVFGLSRGLVRKGERVVSVHGAPGAGVLDSLRVTDVGAEFRLFSSPWLQGRDGELGHLVLARVLEIASEIAEEGREGRPCGTILVVGDYEAVQRHCHQLIINPFQGHPDADRNVLDPAVKETVKELARIDGAFIVRGDGVLMSAGTYLRPGAPVENLQGGLGARHAAALGVTAVTQAVAVAISESTRTVSLFRGGERVLEL